MNRMNDLLALLGAKGMTLGSVESMTCGLFAANAGSVPGASKVYKGGLVTYSVDTKVTLLGIERKTIEEFDVVSERIAKEMAVRGKERLGVDVCLSITGNAGPTAEPGKAAVGETYIGMAAPSGVIVKKCQFAGARNDIREAAVEAMIELAIKNV